MDAKYKKLLETDNNGRLYKNVSRDDKLQMVAYLHVTEAQYGFLLFPLSEKEYPKDLYVDEDELQPKAHAVKSWRVNGYLCHGNRPEIYLLLFKVPESKGCASFFEYKKLISASESVFLKSIIKFLLK